MNTGRRGLTRAAAAAPSAASPQAKPQASKRLRADENAHEKASALIDELLETRQFGGVQPPPPALEWWVQPPPAAAAKLSGASRYLPQPCLATPHLHRSSANLTSACFRPLTPCSLPTDFSGLFPKAGAAAALQQQPLQQQQQRTARTFEDLASQRQTRQVLGSLLPGSDWLPPALPALNAEASNLAVAAAAAAADRQLPASTSGRHCALVHVQAGSSRRLCTFRPRMCGR